MDEQEKASRGSDPEAESLLQAYQDALQQGNAASIEESAMRFFAYACEQMGKEPSPDLVLKHAAHQFEGAGEWSKAEAAYRQSLALAEAANNPMSMCKAHQELSHLYSFLDQKERALESAQSALAAARLSEMNIIVGMALEGVAHSRLHLENASQALQAAEELVQIVPANETMYATQRSRALTLRAHCYVAVHRPAEADQDLAEALPLFAPLSGVAMLAGVQSGLANWWEVKAQRLFLDADFAGAADARRTAVGYRRYVSEAPQLEGPYKYASLAASLHKLGQALLAVEDVTGAEAAFQESRALRTAIQQP